MPELPCVEDGHGTSGHAAGERSSGLAGRRPVRPHGIASEYDTTTPDGYALRAFCWCGLQLTALAPTVRRAQRMLWAKSADHRGMAYAAGPMGET